MGKRSAKRKEEAIVEMTGLQLLSDHFLKFREVRQMLVVRALVYCDKEARMRRDIMRAASPIVLQQWESRLSRNTKRFSPAF